jgi:glycosyltransferase involved in cell wall biosynthesis
LAGGRIHRANRAVGGLQSWARRLQAPLSEADLIVLHADNMDVIPFLALAGMRRRPPTVLLNHSDHVLWLGAGSVDLVVSSRRSGLQLCNERRGIEKERNVLLPLCLEPLRRRFSRVEAKRALGLPDDSLVILTVARAVKFKTIGAATFADALVPVLRANPRLRLVAVGPGGAVDWSQAAAEVPDRLLTLAERPDTQLFRAAADIYVDSFPFVSITSMFEAGLHGLPLVTRYPFGSGCEVLGADSPGLDGVTLRTRSIEDFQHVVECLGADAALRAETGSRTAAEIEAVNTGEGWKRALARVYERALTLPRRDPLDQRRDGSPQFRDLDLFSPFVYGEREHGRTPAARLALATEINLKALPPGRRLRTWSRMAWRRDFKYRGAGATWRYLLPEWLGCRARTLLAKRV